MLRKTIKCLLLGIACLILQPNIALADAIEGDLGAAGDKWEGTSGVQEIENAIAASKTLLNYTEYLYGGGHGDEMTDKDKPEGLDCSGFTSWMYRKGAGVQLKAGKSYTTFSVYDGMDSKYLKDAGPNGENLKRGDLIVCNGDGHIVTFLGGNGYEDGNIIGSNGGFSGIAIGQYDHSGGVSIMPASYYPASNKVIDMAALIKDGAFDKYEDVLDPSSLGAAAASGETTGDKEPETGYYASKTRLRNKKVVSMNLGLRMGSEDRQSGAILVDSLLAKFITIASWAIVAGLGLFVLWSSLGVTLMLVFGDGRYSGDTIEIMGKGHKNYVGGVYKALFGRELYAKEGVVKDLFMCIIFGMILIVFVMLGGFKLVMLGVINLIQIGVGIFT